ncbi:MAG: reverse transcriptase domain-containing protein [Candidatus Omnitrophota bacterium]
MKSSQPLLQKVQTPSNLLKAWFLLNRSNHSSHGLSNETIESFGKNFEVNRKEIRKELKKGQYKFSSLRAAVVTKTKLDGTVKRRGIRISEIKDRVVQRAIVNKIEPVLTKKFSLNNEASFAYLKKRNVKKALLRMIQLYRQKKIVLLEADLEKYFDTVNREKLLNEMIFPALPDKSLNDLIAQAVAQEIGNLHSLEKDDWELFPDSGIPQGGGLSPLFANVYLSQFDQTMLSKGFGLVRYADDFIVLCENDTQANEAYALAVEILEKKLDLKLHKLGVPSSKTRIIRPSQECFEFLGVRFDGKYVYPGAKAIKNLKERIKEVTLFHNDSKLLWVLTKLKYVLEGWISCYSYTKCETELPHIEAYIKERLGGCAGRMKWSSHRGQLTKEQYRFSGLFDLNECLIKQRKNLKKEELEILGLN